MELEGRDQSQDSDIQLVKEKGIQSRNWFFPTPWMLF